MMVTGHQPARHRLAQAAVRSFQAQTYSPRELVIVNQGSQPLLNSELFHVGGGHYGMIKTQDYTIRELLAPVQPLGAVRNQCLEACRGEWLLPWDDDDWSHPDRIARQMAARDGQRAVVPCRYVAYSFVRNSALIETHKWCSGLMLFPRTTHRYDAARGKSEDWVLMEAFPDRMRWENPALIYLRFYHGQNTWHERHVMWHLAGKSHTWQLPAEAAQYLRQTLRAQYPWHQFSG